MTDGVPWQVYVDRRLDDMQRAAEAIRAADKEAVRVALDGAREEARVALTAQQEWRAQANEWRGAMTDRDRNYVTRVELDNLSALLGSLASRLDAKEGQSTGRRDSWEYLVAVVGVLVAVAAIVVAALVT